MPITEEQLAERKKHLGSSDMAALFGLDPFQNAHDVYLQKTADLEPAAEQDYQKAGNDLENLILDWAEPQLGPLTRNQFFAYDGLPIAVNSDAIVTQSGEPVEVKTSGIFGPILEIWGDTGTDQVPDRVLIQCQTILLCTKKEVCHVPVLLGGRGYGLYVVPSNPETQQLITETAVEFWQHHVQKRIAPENVTPSLSTVKRLRHIPETVVEIPDAIVKNWLRLKEALSAHKKEKEQAEAQLLAALGEAEAGQCNLGMVTYFEQSRKAYSVAASKYRVLRLKKSH